MEQTMKIAGHNIGNYLQPYIVAEISGEHMQSFEKACELIGHAKGAGADAVKFQLYNPYELAMMRGGTGKIGTGPWKDLTYTELYRQTFTPQNWFRELFSLCDAINITMFSSVFSKEGVRYLESLHCPSYKIASPEIIDKELILYTIKTGKPVIISLGHATHQDVIEILNLVEQEDKRGNLAFLHCVSEYPCPIDKINLKFITNWRFSHIPLGFSDHTSGIAASISAVTHGAAIIEKHITLSNKLGGWDRSFSLEPKDFKQMVKNIKEVYEMRK